MITRPDARDATAPPATAGPARGGRRRRPDAALLGVAGQAVGPGTAPSQRRRRRARQPGRGPGGQPGDRPAAAQHPAESLLILQQAVVDETRLWIGYVNAEGRASQRVIAPVKVEGGYVTAYDHAGDEVRTFALHRITGVAELAEDDTASA